MKVVCDSEGQKFVSEICRNGYLKFTDNINRALTFETYEDVVLAWYLAYRAEKLNYGHFYVASLVTE